VLREDAKTVAPEPTERPAGAPRDQAGAARNEAKTPSHLVGNRSPNQPTEVDEVPPEVREHFDARDESEPD
jgi:hypothetical protein